MILLLDFCIFEKSVVILSYIMRLLICSMPILALAMLVSNYSAHHGWVEETRKEPDPEAKAIAQKIWGVPKPENMPSPRKHVLVAVLED